MDIILSIGIILGIVAFLVGATLRHERTRKGGAPVDGVARCQQPTGWGDI